MDKIHKLQQINPEKFSELCRMHLSFILDLHDDEFSALTDGKNKQKNRRGYFCRKHKEKQPLSLLFNAESISHIYRIIDHLGKDANICKEGVFRKTGSLSRQQEIKSLLSSGAAIDLNSGQYNVHDLASVLKGFLADLPEPLLTEAHYSAHCQIPLLYNEKMSPDQKQHAYLRQLKSTQLLFLLLPPDNYSLLKHLLFLLKKVTTAREKNLMNAHSLATLFAPHILCPRKMTAEVMKGEFSCMVKSVGFMIEHACELFEPPFELVKDVIVNLNEVPSTESAEAASSSENEPVKTVIAFCDRTKTGDENPTEYTNKALAELQSYIQNLPNSARKRKLIKKFQNENSSENIVECGRRKHYRSRSVGEVIRKHFWRSSRKRKEEGFYKNSYHSSFDMLASNSKSSESLDEKCQSEEVPKKTMKSGPSVNKLPQLGKNLFRASKKIKAQPQTLEKIHYFSSPF